MTKDRRLGRGLAALLGTPPGAEEASATDESSGATSAVSPPPTQAAPPTRDTESSSETESANSSSSTGTEIAIDLIDPNPHQPRRDFDAAELKSLAASLTEHRLLQPILVRRVDDRYQLVSGERRWRAAQLAGWDKIPATVREADDRVAAEWALVENLQRKDLSAIEKARSFERYLNDHDATQEELAKRLQLDRSTVTNLLRLLELPTAVQQLVQDAKLTAGHARALLALGDESLQEEFSRTVVKENWSVRETERQVQQRVRGDGAQPLSQLEQRANRLAKKSKSRQTAALERQLKMALGAKVEIQQSGKQTGKIVIHFSSHEEFERLHRALAEGRVDAEAA